MLNTLRRIIQEVNAAQNLPQALAIMVKRVKQAVAVETCSVFLAAPHTQHFVLMASDGLNPAAIGVARLARGEGLIGVIAETAEPLNLDNAPDHPRYRFIAETGEERLHAFLGVPIIHHRKVLGVLVIRQRARRRFDEDEVAFLVTVAAQLSGAIAHAEASGGIDGLRGTSGDETRYIDGLPGAPGVAVGTAMVVYPPADLDAVPDRKVTTDNIETEVATFMAAVMAVQTDIQALSERLNPVLRAEDRALFDAYRLMLGSDSLVDKTVERIRQGSWASGALRETVNEHARIFDEMDDPYIRERAEDIRDLGRRILVCLQKGKRNQPPYPDKTILIGEEITATTLAEVPHEKLAGVVSARGSSSSHVAILARALGVPAVVGADDLPVARLDGQEMIVDGHLGRLFIQPSAGLRAEFARLEREEAELTAGLAELRDQPAMTTDGAHIPLYANTGLLADIASSLNSGAEGIGLYRTEIPFMVRPHFPSEEEQRRVYRQVLESYAPRPVTLRTLDVGGDKELPYFPIEEDNPFLGWRGIRITLDHPEIFLVQLRAMLRASSGLDNLNLLLPMISSVTEIDDTLALLERAWRDVTESGETIARPRIGVMVEVPSAVYQAESLARRVDFLSIGSNDLTQYLLAVDRNNARVAGLYDSLHPAVLHAAMQVIEGAHRQNKPVSVCGEMAGDPAAALLLVGMGIDSLSMSASSLPRVKWVIRNFSRAQARDILNEALTLEHPAAIRARVNERLMEAGLGGLVRGGTQPASHTTVGY
ncbi:MAG: phosphoenolpyruvate--protein phosphotransferase [Gammaproteobacteria bacterium]|nr:phosphoenolpyruvate--protein phosphotransferase [Gammaproteobacteria bacterium]